MRRWQTGWVMLSGIAGCAEAHEGPVEQTSPKSVGDLCALQADCADPSAQAGDVDGNGIVEGKDAAALRRFVLGSAGAICAASADVSIDGVVDRRDLMILRRHLAGDPAFANLDSPECEPDTGGELGHMSVRGLMLHIDGDEVTPSFLSFIRNDLAAEGTNTLVLGINYSFDFDSYPEVIDGNPVTYDQAADIADACADAGINCIPAIQLVSHQGCYGVDGLLRAFPEFDANPPSDTKPAKPTTWDYCRSYNPYHPGVNDVVLPLVDELIDAFGASDIHVGMDEMFMLPEFETSSYAGTPYYDGQPWSQVFADAYEPLRSHIVGRGARMWLWGDRLLDAYEWGTAGWEADAGTGDFAIHPAIDLVSREGVVVADWHYTADLATAELFAGAGFNVVSSPLEEEWVALAQFERHNDASPDIASRMSGTLQTTWRGAEEFQAAYELGHHFSPPYSTTHDMCVGGRCFDSTALNAANAFRAVMAEYRALDE